jgi:hypothetical protein
LHAPIHVDVTSPVEPEKDGMTSPDVDELVAKGPAVPLKMLTKSYRCSVHRVEKRTPTRRPAAGASVIKYAVDVS